MEKIAVDFDGSLTKLSGRSDFKIPDICYLVALKILNPKPRKDIVEKVTKWKKAGFQIIILSARPKSCYKMTKKWLRKQKVKVNEIILVGPGKRVKEDKLLILKKKKIKYYYGDNSETIEFLKKNGIISFKI